ncbi:peptidase M15 [Halodesulfovibrio sp.]|uniref:peptidase M15 n=1 Tax=Halodesulfovibrio sp. TaxID=1912772 RepID=UPI0025C2E69E|nr:peptidase M15 [Halodesulfovibrio sp.]
MKNLTGYRTDRFALYELLPKYEYSVLSEATGWGLFDPRMLWTLDRLQERFGTAIMNDWYWGGSNQFRGWRPFACPVGAEWSTHKFGRAGDIMFKHCAAEEVRAHVLANPEDGAYQFITCIEMKVDWFHFDTRNFNTARGILKIYP